MPESGNYPDTPSQLPIVCREVVSASRLTELGGLLTKQSVHILRQPRVDLVTLPEMRSLPSETISEYLADEFEAVYEDFMPEVSIEVNSVMLSSNRTRYISLLFTPPQSMVNERQQLLTTVKRHTGIEKLPRIFNQYKWCVLFASIRRNPEHPSDQLRKIVEKTLPIELTLGEPFVEE